MEEMLKVVNKVTIRLVAEKIPYMISGSVALSVYAAPRFTNDIDLVIDILPAQKNRLIQIFENDFYISETSVQDAFRGTGMFNIIDYQSMVKCDLILLERDRYAREAFQRRAKLRLSDYEFNFISLEDLIIRKLLWNRISPSDTQLKDVEQLIRVNRNKLDVVYVRRESENKNILIDLEKFL